MDGEESGVPDAIRHVFSKEMHMQLFSGMQVLSGGLAGKGWADHDARLYTVLTEELMIQWWTDLIMFSHAGLDAASRAPFGARAKHAGCLSYLASHLLNGYFPLDEATRRLGGCWAMKELPVCPEIRTQFSAFAGNFVVNSKNPGAVRGAQVDFDAADHTLASNRIDAGWESKTQAAAADERTQACALQKMSKANTEIVAEDGTVNQIWKTFEDDCPGGLFGNEVDQNGLGRAAADHIATTSSGGQVYSVVGKGLHPLLLLPASKDEFVPFKLDQIGDLGTVLFLKEDLLFDKAAVEALIECEVTYKAIVDMCKRHHPDGPVA